MKTLACFLGLTTLALFAASSTASADNQAVIVHEWGTFTCLQDDHGRAIGGINVDDEPVPYFVCQYANRLVAGQYSKDSGNFGLPPYNADGGKGWTIGDPTVTMRLETPVIYIYPPKGQTARSVPPLDVHVDFHGGVLSQYYPYAVTNGADLNGNTPYLANPGITETMTTGLTWKNVKLGSTLKPVETDDQVWTTPRETSAPLLEVHPMLTVFKDANGVMHDDAQAEHFLFYRGVGHLDSPLLLNRASLDDAGKRGDIFPWCHRILAACPSFEPPAQGTVNAEAWLADIHADGSCRWEYLPILFDASGGRVAGKFVDFKDANFTKLKSSMHDALVKEGLYDDEATAMLKTWELSYFKSPGLRFFYIVPRAWVDKVLPLKVTGAPADITRVMVARIELITDAQRAALARLAAGPCPDLPAFKNAATDALGKERISDAVRKAYFTGAKPLADLGIAIPPLVQDYLSLGRFRDALIIHEQERHPSAALAQFIADNNLEHEKMFQTIQAATAQTKAP